MFSKSLVLQTRKNTGLFGIGLKMEGIENKRSISDFYTPAAGGRVGGVPHSLSGAYLQDYASYGYETSWVDRSHQGGVQCTGTITLACLIF